jgi:hypothetical protein
MGDETQQLIIRLFSELKEDIRAVAIGKDDHKEKLKDDISAVTDEISAVKNDIENSISDNISAVKMTSRTA